MTTPPHKFTGAALMVFFVKTAHLVLELCGAGSSFLVAIIYCAFVLVGLAAALLSHFFLDWIDHIDFFTFQRVRKSRPVILTFGAMEFCAGVLFLWYFLQYASAEIFTFAVLGALAGLWVDIHDHLLPEICGLRFLKWRWLHKTHLAWHSDASNKPLKGIFTQLATVATAAFVLWLLI